MSDALPTLAACADLLDGPDAAANKQAVLDKIADLEMKAVSDTYSIEDAAVEAVWAGCDAVLICSDEALQGRAHEALVRRAEKEPRFKDRCVEAAERGIRVRRLARPSPLPPGSVGSTLSSMVPAALVRELAALAGDAA